MSGSAACAVATASSPGSPETARPVTCKRTADGWASGVAWALCSCDEYVLGEPGESKRSVLRKLELHRHMSDPT